MKTMLNLLLLCTILCLEGSIAVSSECPAVDPLDHSVYLSHESDCSKFYQCSNGVPILLECPEGTLFNTDLDVCDWPDNVVCEKQKCPEVDPIDTSIYLPHDSDCSKFYQCSNGVAIEQSCPSGLVFNTKLNVCDYPENVQSCSGSSGNGTDGSDGNGDNNGNEENDGNDASSGNDESDANEGSGVNNGSNGSEGNDGNDEGGDAETDSGSSGNAVCPAVDSLNHSTYLPHENDCSKFYQCSNGVPILLECPEGTLFNTDLNVCDWPDNVVCEKQKCPEVDPIDTSIYLPHDSDCSKFYQCSNGVAIEQSCPSGLVFNTKLNVCDYPNNVDSC